MARSNTVVVKFIADVAAMRKGVDKTNSLLSGFGRTVARVGTGIAAAFSARAITEFASESVKAASDLQESLSKVEQVFGGAGNVEKWAEDSATAFGLSSQAALEAAGTYGNLFTSFGIGAGQASLMSTALVELAADLGSFNNTSVEQAITALRSGLSGETEPLKRYGVALTAAEVKSKAFALGLVEVGGELTQAAKAQATYQLILEKTTNAQGDFQRTADGLANTQRTLNAAWEDAKATIGDGLLQAIQEFNDGLGGPQGLADRIDFTADQISYMVQGLGVLLGDINTNADAQKDYNKQLEKYGKELDESGDGVLGFAKRLGILIRAQDDYINFLELAGFQAKKQRDEEAKLERRLQAKFNIMTGNVKVADQFAVALDVINGKQDAAGRAVSATTARINEQTQAWIANAKAAQAGNISSPEIARSARQMDSFGREIDKQSIYWKNAADTSESFFDSLNQNTGGGGGGGGGGSSPQRYFQELSESVEDFTFTATLSSKKLENVSEKTGRAIDGVFQKFVTSVIAYGEKAKQELEQVEEYVVSFQERLLGPTNVSVVNSKYEASLAKTARLTEDLAKAQQTLAQARAADDSRPADQRRGVAAELEAVNRLQKELSDSSKESGRGFLGFWNDAQTAVDNYRKQLDGLLKSELIPDSEAGANFFASLLDLAPDVGTRIIEDLKKNTGATVGAFATQSELVRQAGVLGRYITDTWAGKGPFPAVGFTLAKEQTDRYTAYIKNPKTKKRIAKALRAATPKSVKVKVDWEVPPAPVPSVIRVRGQVDNSPDPSGLKTVSSLMKYERMNGTRWRDIR